MPERRTLLMNMFQSMLAELGPSHWWPGEGGFEVMVGAVLTQNTNWGNVEKALENLRRYGLLSPERLLSVDVAQLAEFIRPAGYYRLKAGRLNNLLRFFREECKLRLECLEAMDMDELREKLLGVKGVGPETADSILLYALNMPSFVVDTYTMRIMNRHGLVPEDADYHELRDYFMDVLPGDAAMYNEFHALIVRTAKEWCKKKNPCCDDCPLRSFL